MGPYRADALLPNTNSPGQRVTIKESMARTGAPDFAIHQTGARLRHLRRPLQRGPTALCQLF
eukprot:2800870-Pyramimonas_sp.AAC.1